MQVDDEFHPMECAVRRPVDESYKGECVSTRGRQGSALLTVLILLAVPRLFAQVVATPELRMAILGDPVHKVPWTDEGVERLKAIGFNAVQLNIAWGSRPFGEPLNLIDVVTVPGEAELPDTAARRAELKRRVALARRHGLRTLFHFGSPFMDRNPYTGDVPGLPYRIDDATFDSWYDVLNPKVREHEVALIREFRRQFPDVDDILVYTYDQDAWQTPEFQYTKFSYGIPLAARLSGYLAALHQVWTEGRSGKARMWWEPWELSAGQVFALLPQLPRADFGLMLHSNIAEAQLALPVDGWFRNVARMCRGLGIPVVAESFFASASEEIEPLSIPAPRLVDEEYAAFARVPGIVGIKEYYGINTGISDLDLDLLQARLRDPARSTEDLLTEITKRFGVAQSDVRAYLDLLADAYEAYPWDASWHAREVGRASTDHGWRGATIQGLVAPTPSWESTRHGRFMKTDNLQPEFWMLEDVQLRCKLAADLLDKASDLSGRLLNELPLPADQAQFRLIQQDVDVWRRVSRSYALHLRETNVAQMLRQDLAAGRPMNGTLVKELGQLLDADVANQKGHGRVNEMRRLYLQSPAEFVDRYLIPVEIPPGDKVPFSRDLLPWGDTTERGIFTLTTR
jgi:hypothetical protein